MKNAAAKKFYDEMNQAETSRMELMNEIAALWDEEAKRPDEFSATEMMKFWRCSYDTANSRLSSFVTKGILTSRRCGKSTFYSKAKVDDRSDIETA